MLNTSVNLSEIIIQTEDTSLASQINICILFSKAKALLFVLLSLKLSLSCSLSFVGEKNYTQSNNSNSKVAGPAVKQTKGAFLFRLFFPQHPQCFYAYFSLLHRHAACFYYFLFACQILPFKCRHYFSIHSLIHRLPTKSLKQREAGSKCDAKTVA